jgi:cytochrome c oxidase subunit 2
VSLPAAQLLATNFGSPSGITTTSKDVLRLWVISYYFAIPIGAIVIGGVVWCIVRYRARPGDTRLPKQFQYHIPIEAAYTIIPLVVVAIIFGFMYGVDNKIDNVSKHPAVKITVDGFQWGWRFVYANGYQEVGSVATEPSINDSSALPVLRMPEHETVQFALRSEDVNHSFYVPEFLFQRDMIQGINNVVDINVTTTGTFVGECTQLCGTYHALMRFEVDVMPQKAYAQWYSTTHPTEVQYAGSNT